MNGSVWTLYRRKKGSNIAFCLRDTNIDFMCLVYNHPVLAVSEARVVPMTPFRV